CHMHGHIGSGGERPIFESATLQVGFSGNSFPSSQLRLPHSAIYGVEGEFIYKDFKGGGVVTLEINGATLFTIPGYTDAWTRFSIAEEFYAEEGDFLSFTITHNDTTADADLHGNLTIATKEPLFAEVRDPCYVPALYEPVVFPQNRTLGTDGWENLIDLPTTNNRSYAGAGVCMTRLSSTRI